MDNKIILLDGGMGTQLQMRGLKPGEIPEIFGMKHPEVVYDIHFQYLKAGAKIIYANTFGANRKKLKKANVSVEEVIIENVKTAKKAAANNALVALDIGPIGELMEPNGYLSIEDAYDIYKEMIIAGVKAKVDLVVFETMSDLMEVKTAILAVKENSNLPIFVTMSFESDHRSFTGCCAASFALLCERLMVDAIGVNCSLGPDEIYPIIKEISQYSSLPLIVKANAGLPDPITNTYSMDAKSFCQKMKQYEGLPVKYVGGCCGSDPSFIQALNELDWKIELNEKLTSSFACTPTKCVELNGVHVIGERINPTGNKRMKQALLNHQIDEIINIALEQVEAGADLLDVNVGVPGIDEEKMMVEVIKELQAVVDVPLQIDSTNPKVIEAALRVYHGIPNVNSINGEQKSMDAILPLIKKYGANVVGLTLDENGIPHHSNDRFNIALKIIDEASKYDIEKNRVFIDALTLTVSAQQSGALESLETLRRLKNELHVNTVLGVSNISFGLPRRLLLNQAFLTMALQAGLTMPIINPNQHVMMEAVRSYRVLACLDIDSVEYIEAYANTSNEVVVSNQTSISIEDAILKGLKEETRNLTKQLLQNKEPLDIVNEHLIPALDRVGDLYEQKKLYLPQLINAATASQQAFDELKQFMNKIGAQSISKGKILLATVHGDVHDIGKNIVKVVLENYGYQVYDLGKDVPKEKIVETAIKENIYLIGLSALMTTTLKAMEETIIALHEAKHPCKVMVGGAVVSQEYADKIHADYYAKDAKQSADIAKEVLGS